MVDLIQLRIAPAISISVDGSPITILKAEPGMAPVPTIKLALSYFSPVPSFAGGDWRTGGYLAGLQEVIDSELMWAADNRPELAEAAHQGLKQLFPLMVPHNGAIPKCITNTSTKDEPTQIHHHEHQRKLLVALAEFLIECTRERNESHIVVIDQASSLSNLAKTLIKFLVRLEADEGLFRFVVVDYEQRLYFPDASEVHFGRYSLEELAPLLCRDLALEKQREIYQVSGGNPLILKGLSICERAGVQITGDLDPVTIVDRYLANLTVDERRNLLKSYIASNCTMSDLIAQRNYEVFEHATADRLHEHLHHICLHRYLAGEAPLVMLHALSVRDKNRQLELSGNAFWGVIR